MLLKDYKPTSKLRTSSDTRSLPSFPVIEFHSHWGRFLLGDNYGNLYDTKESVDRMRAEGIVSVVNLDGENEKHLEKMIDKTDVCSDFIHTFGNVDISRIDEPAFESYVYNTLTKSKKMGISGIKFLKNAGLVIKDSKGAYIRPNDKRLSCIWQTAAELSLPVLYHIADPIAFFDPVDYTNERYEELCMHPDWSFSSPEQPTFARMMEMQEQLLYDNPRTTFIIPHVGSCAEDLSYVSRLLEQFPNMYIDIAARVAELGRQPYTARKFFLQYSDRILYGNDSSPVPPYSFKTDFRFLETMDEYFDYNPHSEIPPQGRWKIYGIGLPDDVLRKVYYENARKLLSFSGIKKGVTTV